MSRPTLQWLFLRFVSPIIVVGAVVVAARGRPFFELFGLLVWTLFAVHLLCTFTFKKTHLLDTGSFFLPHFRLCFHRKCK